MKTFTCNFGNGISCTIKVSDTPPEKGKNHIQKMEWTKKPNIKKIIRKYINWMNSVNQQLSNEWGVTLLHIFTKPNQEIEAWGYEPNKAPKLIVI